MTKSILALIKVGKKEHLQEFREQGLLFMRSPAAFRDLESDTFRGDRFEGCNTIIQPRDIGEFTFTNSLVGKFTVSPLELAGPVLIGLDKTASCNIYCMFAITQPIDGGFDSRLFEVPDADSLIAVLSPSEFIKKVSNAAEKHLLTGKCGLVNYYDPNRYSGEIGVFSKPATFRLSARIQAGRLAGLGPAETTKCRWPHRHHVGSRAAFRSE
jgi:hypothetical protein